ncbi:MULTISPECIES: hypothetical protein, partial [Streptomyces]
MIFEKSSFSEEKEAKRLLSVIRGAARPAAPRKTGKSFLVLFFKKELLLFLLVAAAPRLPDGPPPEIDHP